MRLSSITVATVAAGVLAAGAASGSGGPYLGALQGRDGVLARHGTARYVALESGRRTVVAAIRVRDGRVLRWRSLQGTFGIPLVTFGGGTAGVSKDGRTLVVGPAYRSSTSRFAVLRALTFRVERIVRLDGTFSFDALSPDGRMLYLVEFLSVQRNRYRIRAYDVAAGRLLAKPVVAKSDPGAMRGFPMARVTSPTGRWAYTLYQESGGGFVHALDTVARRAFCIDLPRMGERVALRGSRLLVTRRDGKAVAAIDTRTLRLVT